MKKQQTHPINIADFPLLGQHIRPMLKISGYSFSQFAAAIGRSPSYVSGLLARRNNGVPLQRVRQLIDFLGEENFCEA